MVLMATSESNLFRENIMLQKVINQTQDNSKCESKKIAPPIAQRSERVLRSNAKHAKNENSIESKEENQFETKTSKRKLTTSDEDKENDSKIKQKRRCGKRIIKSGDEQQKSVAAASSSKNSLVKRICSEVSEIVFAKMRGYCSWPAKVVILHFVKIRFFLVRKFLFSFSIVFCFKIFEITDNSPRVRILFYGTAQYSVIFKSGLSKFLCVLERQNEDEMNPLLRKAVKEALWEYRINMNSTQNYTASKSSSTKVNDILLKNNRKM